jgi:hypothetical protein
MDSSEFRTFCLGFSEFIAARGFQRKCLCASVSLWWLLVPFLGSLIRRRSHLTELSLRSDGFLEHSL